MINWLKYQWCFMFHSGNDWIFSFDYETKELQSLICSRCNYDWSFYWHENT
jgi:hypothetical protein